MYQESHSTESEFFTVRYFELDSSYLEPGYAYGIQFAYYLQGTYAEQPQTFKFKIKEEDK